MCGRNGELNSCAPAMGEPGHKTTKPGRFWFSEPRPYVSQEPIDGRPGTRWPQFIRKSDGSWFGISVYIERITQTSSIESPSLGKISLISMPLLPQRRKAKGEASRLPVLRSVFRLPLGMGWPLYFCSIGLGSNVSTWEGPPLRKRKMTCLAVAVKCGALGAIGAVAPARVFVAAAPGRVLVAACCDASRIPASPAMPKP